MSARPTPSGMHDLKMMGCCASYTREIWSHGSSRTVALAAPCTASQRSSASPMPPKNRRSAAFSKVHKCHARPAAQMKATRRLSTALLVVVFEDARVVSLRKSHLLRAIGVVSSSAMAATSRVVKRARLAKCSLAKTPRGQYQRDSPMRFFFLLS